MKEACKAQLTQKITAKVHSRQQTQIRFFQ